MEDKSNIARYLRPIEKENETIKGKEIILKKKIIPVNTKTQMHNKEIIELGATIKFKVIFSFYKNDVFFCEWECNIGYELEPIE